MKEKALITIVLVLFVSATFFPGTAKAVEILGCYPPEGIYGYVRDNSNYAIYQALVKGAGKSVYTNSQGYYEIWVGAQGSWYIEGSKGPEGGNYWMHSRKATIDCRNPWARADLMLNYKRTGGLTLLAQFPNSIYSTIAYTYGVAHLSTAKAYYAGSGNDKSSELKEQQLRTGPAGQPLIVQDIFKAWGAMKDTNTIVKLYLHGEILERKQGPLVPEYLPKQDSDGVVDTLMAGQQLSGFKEEMGTITLQSGLKTNIGFSYYGGSASFPLESTMAQTDANYRRIDYRIYNTDTREHTFWMYWENSFILHIWDDTQ